MDFKTFLAVGQANISPDALLRDSDLCHILDVTARTTLRWRHEGSGPPFMRLGTRRIMYRFGDVLEWTKKRTFQHRAEEAASAVARRRTVPKEAAHDVAEIQHSSEVLATD